MDAAGHGLESEQDWMKEMLIKAALLQKLWVV
jgi:hypothetical protein